MQTTLRILGVLLDYPQDEVISHSADMKTLLREEQALAPDQLTPIFALLDELGATDLLSLQEDYVACFDRGRSLSLHLFEHVHGESRDRGQAMVDLRETYHQAGLEMDARQLPDYLPVFIEFCAHLEASAARGWLSEVAHILRLLHARMRERDSAYAGVLAALLQLADEPVVDASLQDQARAERPDDTPEKLDEAWAEKPVTFGCAMAACSAAPGAADPHTVPLVRYAAPTRLENPA